MVYRHFVPKIFRFGTVVQVNGWHYRGGGALKLDVFVWRKQYGVTSNLVCVDIQGHITKPPTYSRRDTLAYVRLRVVISAYKNAHRCVNGVGHYR